MPGFGSSSAGKLHSLPSRRQFTVINASTVYEISSMAQANTANPPQTHDQIQKMMEKNAMHQRKRPPPTLLCTTAMHQRNRPPNPEKTMEKKRWRKTLCNIMQALEKPYAASRRLEKNPMQHQVGLWYAASHRMDKTPMQHHTGLW